MAVLKVKLTQDYCFKFAHLGTKVVLSHKK